MKTITIEGQIRTEFGKSATRQLRSEDKVPAVIYGGAKEINFSAPAAAFRDIVYTPEFLITEVKVDGNAYKCVMKDLQFDKITDQLLHVDFVELVPGKKVTVDIPLEYTGSPAGVKEGGRLITELKSIRVKATPENLKQHIEVDISGMHIHDKIRVMDVKAEGMEILNSPKIPIASVTTTRQVKVDETAATATAATAAPAAGAAPAKEGAPAPAAAAAKAPASGKK